MVISPRHLSSSFPFKFHQLFVFTIIFFIGYLHSAKANSIGVRSSLTDKKDSIVTTTVSNASAILPNAIYYLKIPTPDTSGQAVHPSVIDFKTEFGMDSWAGYRYWMAMNPYAFTNATREDPCIIASQDGINWVSPSGLHNPLAVPDTLKDNHADVNIVYNPESDELWLYYMYRGVGFKKADDPGNIRVIKISKNMSCAKPIKVIQFDKGDKTTIVSPCLWRESSTRWHLWAIYMKTDQKLVYSFSSDGLKWSPYVVCLTIDGKDPLNAIGYRSWHISCKPNYPEKRVEFIVAASKGVAPYNNSNQPHFTSAIVYTQCNMATPTLFVSPISRPLILGSNNSKSWDSMPYRASFVILNDNGKYKYQVWYSAKSNSNNSWHIGLTQGSLGSNPTNLPKKYSKNQLIQNFKSNYLIPR